MNMEPNRRKTYRTRHVNDPGELERLIFTYHIAPPERDERTPQEQAETSLKRKTNRVNRAR